MKFRIMKTDSNNYSIKPLRVSFIGTPLMTWNCEKIHEKMQTMKVGEYYDVEVK